MFTTIDSFVEYLIIDFLNGTDTLDSELCLEITSDLNVTREQIKTLFFSKIKLLHDDLEFQNIFGKFESKETQNSLNEYFKNFFHI